MWPPLLLTPGLSLQAWKAHLMGPMGCTMNLRRTHVLQKAPAALQGEDGLPDTAATATRPQLSLPALAPKW